jgi:anhydro-N-acetylmuramic acid kinase
MSGTSLDGLDLCYAEFNHSEDDFGFHILKTFSYAYDDNLRNELDNAINLDPESLQKLHLKFGDFIGETINEFIYNHQLEWEVDAIASHGQTVFHEPQKGITLQIGDGQNIANKTKVLVVNDFRILDVQLGGQGAPLVPIGDRLLFGEFESCLNLGGIANISFEKNEERIAFDICPANHPLNYLSQKFFHKNFDKDGALARSGEAIPELIHALDNLAFYQRTTPKSLGVEWLNNNYYPVIAQFEKCPPINVLKSVVLHETTQIAEILNKNDLNSVLVTGGGAYNSFFISELQQKTTAKIILPEKEIIEFKEALIFGFLGFLNLNNQINTLSTVTGASRDSIGGIRHYPANQ